MLWLRWKAARQRYTFERTIVWRHLLRIIFFQVKYLRNQDSKRMPCHNPRSGRLFLMAGQPDRVMGPQCLHWVWAGCGSGDFFSERHDLAIHGTCADFGSHRIARGFLEDFHLDSWIHLAIIACVMFLTMKHNGKGGVDGTTCSRVLETEGMLAQRIQGFGNVNPPPLEEPRFNMIWDEWWNSERIWMWENMRL